MIRTSAQPFHTVGTDSDLSLAAVFAEHDPTPNILRTAQTYLPERSRNSQILGDYVDVYLPPEPANLRQPQSTRQRPATQVCMPQARPSRASPLRGPSQLQIPPENSSARSQLRRLVPFIPSQPTSPAASHISEYRGERRAPRPYGPHHPKSFRAQPLLLYLASLEPLCRGDPRILSSVVLRQPSTDKTASHLMTKKARKSVATHNKPPWRDGIYFFRLVVFLVYFVRFSAVESNLGPLNVD
jgi:hypothetical protein